MYSNNAITLGLLYRGRVSGVKDDSLHGDEGQDTVIYNTSSANFIIYRDHADYLTIVNTGNLSTTGYGTDKIYNDVETITFSDLVLDLKDGTLDDVGSEWGYNIVNGTASSDIIYGTVGRDIIHADAGSDTLYGGGRDDQLFGGNGNDQLFGDEGNDILYGEIGNDYIHGGEGIDRAIFSGNFSDYSIVYNPEYTRVQDNVGMDGADNVYSDVESIVFNDGIYDNINHVFTPNLFSISFSDINDFTSYSGLQDAGGTISIIDAGVGVELQGNTWKKVDLDYLVTKSTVLTFEYKSTSVGELQGISLDKDDSFLTGSQVFKLYGTQSEQHFNADYAYVGAGEWQTFSISVGAYMAGQMNYLTFINDNDANPNSSDSSFRNITLQEGEKLSTDTGILSFDGGDFSSYSGTQDAGGVLSAIESGVGVELQGNAWKMATLDYVVTGNTVLSFDFMSSSEGEIQGISLEKDDSFLTGAHAFKLFGTQSEAHFNESYSYDGSGSWQHFEIKVGDYLNGQVNYLSFINDDDSSLADSSSMFRNVRIYDAVEPSHLTPVIFDQNDFSSYSTGQDISGTATVLGAGNAISLSGNLWKKIDFDYSITTKTVLSFEYKSDVQGEIQGIGLDSDNDFRTGFQTFQIYGDQSHAQFNQDFSYDGSGDWQGFTVNVGAYQTGDIHFLTFTNDHDVSNPTVNSEYRNIRIYEDPMADIYDNYVGQDGVIDNVVVNHTAAEGVATQIENFNSLEGDTIDISSLLEQYDPVNDAIADFVSSREENGHLRIYVDEDGAGSANNMTFAVQINNVSQVDDIQTMVDNGNLIL